MCSRGESECGSDPLLLATSSGEKSVKRRHSDDEEEDSDHNNDNKISDGEEYDVKGFEEKYDKRYTEEDNEYKECIDRPTPKPPILMGYYGKNRNRDGFGGYDRSGSRGRYDGRGRGGGRDSYNHSYDHNNRRPYHNQRPYERY